MADPPPRYTGRQLATRVAAVADTDLRGTPLPDPQPPAWHSKLDGSSARFFWSQPTLEPSLVEGNEELIERAFLRSKLKAPDPITADAVDQFFASHSRHKGKFALALALELDKSLGAVVVPPHITEMFAWLYDGTEPESTLADDTD